jgi:hypothetical protein
MILGHQIFQTELVKQSHEEKVTDSAIWDHEMMEKGPQLTR